MARGKGEGTYEQRKADKKFRHVRESNGKRIVGPFKDSKTSALEAWKEKVKSLHQPTVDPDEVSVGREMYYCLFGVYEATSDAIPTTRGPWASELAPTTYQLYRDAFKNLKGTSIMDMRPSEVDVRDLEQLRTILLGTRTSYKKRQGEDLVDVMRGDRNPRTVQRYMAPALKVLKRNGNKAGKDLGALKLPPPRKAWLKKEQKAEYLACLYDETYRLAALMMLHGMSIGEVCMADRKHLDGKRLRVETQLSEIRGDQVERAELKRPRRYRHVPLNDELRERVEKLDGRLVKMRPSNLRRGIMAAIKGKPFESVGPHDLRRSGAKWMLDAGNKLSDVAAILGNDPKTLLAWYDTSDEKGMENAVVSV